MKIINSDILFIRDKYIQKGKLLSIQMKFLNDDRYDIIWQIREHIWDEISFNKILGWLLMKKVDIFNFKKNNKNFFIIEFKHDRLYESMQNISYFIDSDYLLRYVHDFSRFIISSAKDNILNIIEQQINDTK